jgi:hypothetical protein
MPPKQTLFILAAGSARWIRAAGRAASFFVTGLRILTLKKS